MSNEMLIKGLFIPRTHGGPGLAWLPVVCGCMAGLKQRWRQPMVVKLTLNCLATALVDIPAVSMPIARSLKT